MAAVTEKEIVEIANQYIDRNFPTPLGNKKNIELRDKQAIERTMMFVGAFGMGLERAIRILKE